jgi:ribosomal-protein-alanine N-acetyltransferase
MIFNTPRITVRPFKLTDASDLEDLLSDAQVMKFIGNGGFQINKTSSVEMIKWYQDSIDNRLGTGAWAVVEKNSNKVIGNCHLSKIDSLQCVEFGLAITRVNWRRGFGTEICKGLLKYSEEKGLAPIVAVTHINNYASKKLLLNLGLHFEKLIEHHGISQELFVL